MQLQSRGSFLQFGDTILHPTSDVQMILTATKVSFQSLSTGTKLIEPTFLYTEITNNLAVAMVDKAGFLAYVTTL